MLCKILTNFSGFPTASDIETGQNQRVDSVFLSEPALKLYQKFCWHDDIEQGGASFILLIKLGAIKPDSILSFELVLSEA